MTTVLWPDPLPTDKMVKLNEIMTEMSMGLESSEGALLKMGEPFPKQKLQEVTEQRMEDMKNQAAMGLLQAQAAQFTMMATGMTPTGEPLILPGTEEKDKEGQPTGNYAPQIDPVLSNEIMARAYPQSPPERTSFEGN